jgi:hypothetical protein
MNFWRWTDAVKSCEPAPELWRKQLTGDMIRDRRSLGILRLLSVARRKSLNQSRPNWSLVLINTVRPNSSDSRVVLIEDWVAGCHSPLQRSRMSLTILAFRHHGVLT